MRKHLLLMILVALLALAIGPAAQATTKNDEEPAAQAPVAVQRVAVPSKGIRDEATMVLVGTILIGIAAAVRRAA